MAPAMDRKEHHTRSISPKRERDHHSSHRREKHPDQRREKLPIEKDRSRNSDRSYDRERNIEKEKDRARSYERRDDSDRGRDRERERPKEREERSKDVEKARVRNSERNREKEDESPRTKRLRRAQEEREAEKSEERESRKERRYDRENREEREADKTEERESRKERRHEREKNGREEREDKRRRGSGSPAGRRESSQSRDEVQDARGDSIPRSGDPDALTQMEAAAQELEAKEKQKPSFELSGKLAEETNKVRGVTLLFTEPPEARKPNIRWRFYVFKGGEALNEPLYVHRQSCYLFGRERRVADIPTDHPSCSKQHAVLQYRLVEKEQPDGMMKQLVRPYVMDLESTNGTFINENRIEARRYYELFEKDTIKFGNSSREYVLLHEDSAGK